jgi:hypothetical protein
MNCRSADVYLVEVLSQTTKNASHKDTLPQAINLAALAPLATGLRGLPTCLDHVETYITCPVP